MSEQANEFQVPTQRIHRSQINFHPKNPRGLDKAARKKLKANIKAGKVVSTLTWNKRSSFVIGGNQRLSVMDELKGTLDYHLDVSVVDLDETKEMELLIHLNNMAAQGHWDVDLLTESLKLPGLDLEATSWDKTDLALILPDLQLESLPFQTPDPAQADIERIAKMKEERKGHKQREQQADRSEFYLVAVFGNGEELAKFKGAVGVADSERFIDGKRLADLMGLEM